MAKDFSRQGGFENADRKIDGRREEESSARGICMRFDGRTRIIFVFPKCNRP